MISVDPPPIAPPIGLPCLLAPTHYPLPTPPAANMTSKYKDVDVPIVWNKVI